MTHKVIRCIVHSNTANDIEKPDAALPQAEKETLAATNDQKSTKHCPPKHTELIAVIPLLKRNDKKDDTQSQHQENYKTMVLIAYNVQK